MDNKKFRWRYFIDKPFQVRFIGRFLILVLLGLGVSLAVLGIANSMRFKTNLYFQAKTAATSDPLYANKPFYEVVNPTPVNVFQLQMWPMIWMAGLFIVLIAVFGLFISHKMAGPVYRIKRTLDEATDGKIDMKTLEFRLRKKDELQDLVNALNRFIKKKM